MVCFHRVPRLPKSVTKVFKTAKKYEATFYSADLSHSRKFRFIIKKML
jgi:hypothetical protein